MNEHVDRAAAYDLIYRGKLAEIQSILSVADPEWQSLIKFGLYTGQRLADLASLTWDQVDLQRNEIRLVTRKTGKRLLLPIAGALRTHIESLDPALLRHLCDSR